MSESYASEGDTDRRPSEEQCCAVCVSWSLSLLWRHGFGCIRERVHSNVRSHTWFMPQNENDVLHMAAGASLQYDWRAPSRCPLFVYASVLESRESRTLRPT